MHVRVGRALPGGLRFVGAWIGLLLAMAPMGAGCGSTQPFVWATDLPMTSTSSEVVIQPRDTILVQAGTQKDISGEFVVREDGQYLQPPLGSIRAAGRSTSQLAAELRNRLQGMIVNTEISVSVPKRAPIRVSVIGEVKTPASYELDRDRSVMAALAAAGWLNEFASSDGIYVVRPKETPSRIRFRASDLKAAETHSALFQLRDGDVLVVE
jgi:polysaccharide export outer membrane protein